MVAEDYVSFEVAKLLKDKGFDGECKMKYNHEGTMIHHVNGSTDLNFTTNSEDVDRHSKKNHIQYFLCPTQQMVVKWIRKKYNIEIIIDVCKVGEEHKTMYTWAPVVVTENYIEYPVSQTDGSVFGGLCDEHEQAVEKGILYCLNKLI